MFRRRYAVVYVKDTNQKNGPGHVSTSLIEQSENGENNVSHTSFFPSSSRAILNGLSLGAIPVPGLLASNHEDDLKEAGHVMVKEIGQEEYLAGLKAQKAFSEGVEQRHYYYSVFRRHNPLAPACSRYFESQESAFLSAKQHQRKFGFHPSEDHLGIEVYDDEQHVTAQPIDLHNCVSSTRNVLNAVGVDLEDPVIPTAFTNILMKEHGFEKVDKEEFKQNMHL